MIRLAPVLALALLLTGCQSAGPGASPAPSPLPLAGTSWNVSHVDGKPVTTSPAPTVDFSAGTPAQVSGTGGCNQYTGAFTQDGANLTVTNLAITSMACLDDAVATQEGSFTQALTAAATFTGDATGIVISDKTGTERLRLTPGPAPKPLVGTQWELKSFVEKGASTSLAAGTSISMNIDGTTLHAKACNQINGPVTIDGTSFKVGTLASTRMACPGDQDTQEAKFLDILGAVTTATVAGDTLTLAAPDGRELVFAAKA